MSKLKFLGTALAAVTPIFAATTTVGIVAALVLGGSSLAATYFGVKGKSEKVDNVELLREVLLNFGIAAVAVAFAPISALGGAVASRLPFINKALAAAVRWVLPVASKFPRAAVATATIAPAVGRVVEVAAQRALLQGALCAGKGAYEKAKSSFKSKPYQEA